MEDFPLSQDSANQLGQMGLMSKASLDQIYGDLVTDQHQEQESSKEKIAQHIAGEIASDPNVADIAARVQAYASPGAGAVPTPNPVPTPAPAPIVAPAAPAQPVEASGVDPATLALPGGTHVVEANLSAQAGDEGAALRALEEGIRLKQMAAIEGGRAVQANAAQSGAMYSQAANSLGSIANQFAEKRETIEALRAEQIQKQVAAVDSFNTLQIDPGQYWGSRTTAEKISIGLGMIFSAAGGGTKAMDVVNKAIADDIEIQKANFELKKQGLDVRNTLLGQMHNVVGDMNDAQKLAQASMLDQVKLRLEGASAVAKGQAAKANIMETLGAIKIEQAKLMGDVAKNADSQVRTIGQTNATGSPLPVIPDNTNGLTLPKEYQKRFIAGLGVAQDDEVAERIRKAREAVPVMEKQIDELIDLRKKVGVEAIDSRARARGQALWESLLNKVRGIEALGALDDGTVAVFSAAVPQDPLGPRFTLDVAGMREGAQNLLGDPLIARLEEFKKNARDSYTQKIKSGLAAITPSGAKELTLATGSQRYQKLAGSQ